MSAGSSASARTWSARRRVVCSRTTSSRSSTQAFKGLGGTVAQREPRRYEITHVPAPVRNRDRLIGIGRAGAAALRAHRVREGAHPPPGQPLAAFVCPGHPLLDAVLDLTLERHRDLLKRGTVLVDERDPGTSAPRALLPRARDPGREPHAHRGAPRRLQADALRRTRRQRAARHVHYAPYLDYRPLARGEPSVDALLDRPACAWIGATSSRRRRATPLPRSSPST
jgi:hypothetical protein